MPFYQLTPFKAAPKALIQGTPEYVFGSFNDKTSPTLGYVISDSGTGATSTVVFQITSGNIPIPGSAVTIVGTLNAAGAYNVTNATVLTASVTAQGVATITFSGAGSSASAADGGQVQIPQPEIGDLISAAQSSVPVAAVVGATVTGRSTSATVTLPANSAAFPSTLSGVTVVIQGANFDEDTHYNTIGTITAAGAAGNTYDWQSGQGDDAGGNIASGDVDILSFRFYRLRATAVTGSGYIVGTIMQ